ncbi:MAG: Abi family protein, partial [Clostridiales bacterium]|nr:Abi family protein [Clostridiales bacterium]
MTRQYRAGTTFDDILKLYYFDEDLRTLFFKYICHIEQKLRSLISYSFSDSYSHLEKDYLNAANYNNSRKNASGIQYFIRMLDTEAHINTNHQYVVYQRRTFKLFGFCDMSSSVQSMDGYLSSPFGISVGNYLLLYFVFQYLLFLVLAILLFMLC